MKTSWRSHWALVGILSFLVLTTAVGLTAWGDDPPATAPRADTPKEAAQKLASLGMEHALSGQFDRAYKELAESSKALSDDTRLAAAVKLLEGYQTVSAKSDAERAAEYQSAVEDVQRSMFVQSYLPKLIESGLDKKLRAIVLGVSATTSAPAGEIVISSTAEKNHNLVSAYNKIGTSEALLGANEPADATKLKTNSVKALDDASAILKESLALARQDKGEYAVKFGQAADRLGKQISAYAAVWNAVKPDDAKSRAESARELRKLEDDLGDAMGDLESMVSDKPWQLALSQARLAMTLSARKDKDKVSQEKWYRDLVEQVEKMAKNFVARSEWYDAQSAYSGLQELAPDVETYKDWTKIVQRHVRVLRLYGQKPATQPADGAKGLDDEPSWKDLVSGVDSEMVRSAITQLDENYVTAPDYKKLAKGAITAIKVLAETPQAANSFPALADNQKRAKFVADLANLNDAAQSKPTFDYQDLQILLNQVRDVSDHSVDLPSGVLCVEFTDGFLEELDKFSNMIWPYELQDFVKSTMGNFFGVGIQIGKEPREPLKVVTPLKDSPAYKAGIKAGDVILAVDGVRTEGMNVDALVKKITGPKDTQVVLTIKRPGLDPKDYTLTRAEINIETVKGWQQTTGGNWDYLIDPAAGIGYIRITQFTEQTIKDLKAALDTLKKENAHSLILDLRFDPGGLLRSAGSVADQFIRDGRIVSTKGRQSGESEINATPNGEFLDGDLIVLVNQYSASAAEIVAGALKDHHRAIVVGQRSYGKGSVQNVIYISKRKAVLKVTNAYYYLPSGRCLHRKNGDKDWGVDPDVDVMLTPRQTRRWLDIRRKTDLLQDLDAATLGKDMAEQRAADFQLNTAVMLLQLMQLQEHKTAMETAEAK